MRIQQKQVRKPQAALIKGRCPVASGLKCVFLANDGAGKLLRDSGPFGLDIVDEGAGPTWPAYAFGRYLKRNDPDNNLQQSSATFPYVTELTVMIDATITQGGNYGTFFCLYGGASYTAQWFGDPSTIKVHGYPGTDATATWSMGTRATFAFIFGKANYEIWVNGNRLVQAAGTSTGLYAPYWPMTLALMSNPGQGIAGTSDMYWCYMWDRVLSGEEISSVTDNPWQILSGIRYPIMFGPSTIIQDPIFPFPMSMSVP